MTSIVYLKNFEHYNQNKIGFDGCERVESKKQLYKLLSKQEYLHECIPVDKIIHFYLDLDKQNGDTKMREVKRYL